MVIGANHAEVIPAQAIVERDAVGQAPGIQEVDPAVVLERVARAVAVGRGAAIDSA